MPANRRDEFHLAEYKALREEILQTIKNQYDMQRSIAIFLALVYGFAVQIETTAKPPAHILVLMLWAAPFLVSLVGYRSNLSSDRALILMSDYIRKNIEFGFSATVDGSKAGWETHLHEIRKGERVISIPNIYWQSVLASTFGLFIYKLGQTLFV